MSLNKKRAKSIYCFSSDSHKKGKLRFFLLYQQSKKYVPAICLSETEVCIIAS